MAAILHFSLLWSFFEAEALDTHASEPEILKLSHKWAGEGRLKSEMFASNLAYFRSRYVDSGEVTEQFDALGFHSEDGKLFVLSVLKGKNKDLGDSLGVVLLIAYRLRNNLFHGVKWESGIHGQFDNFTNANEVLMAALDVNRRSGQSSI